VNPPAGLLCGIVIWMGVVIQWAICALIGLWAVVLLLRKYGVLPLRRAGREAEPGGACGNCAHCAVPTPADGPAVPRTTGAHQPPPPAAGSRT
jgi:hypothetical protein